MSTRTNTELKGQEGSVSRAPKIMQEGDNPTRAPICPESAVRTLKGPAAGLVLLALTSSF